jgi:uncharacterized membrane protein YbhN (UPF0104 family)
VSGSEEAGGDGTVFGVEKRKAVLGVVVALALTLGAVAALGQVTSYGKLREALGRAEVVWLAGCFGGQALAWLGYVTGYRAVAAADGGPRFRFRDAARVVTIGLGAYVIGSDAGGLTVDFWAMRAAGSSTHEAARRTLGLNTLQAGGMFAFAGVAGAVVLALGTHGHAALVMAVVWIGISLFVFAASAAVSDRRLAPRLLEAPSGEGRPSWRQPRQWPPWLRVKLRKAFADAVGGVVFARIVIEHPRRYLGGLVGYPLFWLGDFTIMWSALAAFGYHIDPARLVVAEATAWALTFVPLPGGGSGFSEATIAYTLNAVGAPLSPAIFAALVYRAVNFWLPILPALALLPTVSRLREALSRSDHGEPDEDVPVHPEEVGVGAGGEGLG